MSDYDKFEKIFTGSWKCDRDENLEAFMAAAEVPEDMKKMADLKPMISFSREGECIKQKTVLGQAMEFQAVLKLNETLDWKDKDEDPQFHVKILPTFKDGALIQDVSPQKAGGGKRHIVKMMVQGNELIAEMSLPEGSSVTTKRFYKKC